MLLELEARLLRLAHSSVARAPSREPRRRLASSSAELTKVEQMAGLIARRYTQPLTVEEIGRHVGLHPNYAMGLFKRSIGTTIIDYVTKHRVSHAQRLLRNHRHQHRGCGIELGVCLDQPLLCSLPPGSAAVRHGVPATAPAR